MTIIDISTREASQADAPAISRVHAEAWRNAYSGIIPGQTLNRMIARRHCAWWLRAIKKNANICVILFADEVAGYATMRRNPLSQFPAKGEICELYLSPQYHGVGMGRRLFTDAKKSASNSFGAGCIVWALQDNELACRFYRQLGGKIVGETSEMLGGTNLKKIAYLWQ